jgi:2'-5' RNA ligase
MRLFIALPLSDDVISRLIRQRARALRGIEPSMQRAVQPVRPEAMHLTLAFLGDVEEKHGITIAEQLRRACDGTPPLALQAQGLGCFPNEQRPRVLWASVGGDISLLAHVQKDIVSRITKFCPALDQKPFKPHLTLARFRTERAPERDAFVPLQESIEATRGQTFVSWTAHEILLMHSELRPDGARHRILDKAVLGTHHE